MKTPAPLGTRDTSKVPFRVTDEDYIPKERYTSEAFHELEVKHVWRKTWQVAGRVEEIPRAGDFIEYKIGHDNILVLRDKSGELQAFHNACMHRGTQLGQGSGSYPTGKIVCPFHGWEFDLQGACTYIYSKQGFRPDMVEPDKVALRKVQVAAKWGMVWINMDLDAPSLDDYVGPIAQNIDPLWMDKMRVRWWKTIKLNANWKTAQEAFFESYHVQQSHPEHAMFTEPDDMRMDLMDAQGPRVFHPNGHWATLQSLVNLVDMPEDLKDLQVNRQHSNIEMLINYNRVMWVGTQSTTSQRVYEITEEMVNTGVPQDDNFPMILMERVMADYASRKVPYPTPDPTATTWAHVFPNWTFLYGFASVLMYRSRPDGDDPNACIYDFWSLEMRPEGTPDTRPVQATDEFFESMWLVHQDKGNIERVQAGLRTSGFKNSRLTARYEETISVFHQHLDQVLAENIDLK